MRFIAKKVAVWSTTADTGFYRLHEGTSSSLPQLLDGALESCRLDAATSPVSADFARTPPPGEFYWYLVQGESNGPFLPSSFGPRSLDSIGDCGTSCSHSKCETGEVLDPLCDRCIDVVCASDAYCCNTMWDSLCVEQVDDQCGATCE